MSVFDEIREQCPHCGGRINHWEKSSTDYHASGMCLQIQKDVTEKLKIAQKKADETIQKLIDKLNAEKSKSDYLLDLDATFADI